jgi:hypothetical protein
MGSDERKVGRFIDVIGSFRIASSDYQKKPTNNILFKVPVQFSNKARRTHSKFENRPRALRPRIL